MLCSKLCAQKKKLFVMFFKGDLKMVSNQKSENITTSVFFKRFLWCFWFLENLNFFDHFWETLQRMYNFLHFVPLPQLIATDWEHLIKSIFWLNLPYRQDNYIYVVKNHHHYHQHEKHRPTSLYVFQTVAVSD